MPYPRRLGDDLIPAVRRLAARQDGIMVPEIMERYDVTIGVARRFLQRLVAAGYLKRTGERRRRVDQFEKVGPGGFVYRATDKRLRLKEGSWESSRKWSRRAARRSRKVS